LGRLIPAKTIISQAISPSNGYSNSASSLNRESKEVIKGREMDFLAVFSKFTSGHLAVDKFSVLGDILGKTSDPIFITMRCLSDKLIVQSFDKVLKVNGVPVFITNN
jgi:hypothetical protein